MEKHPTASDTIKFVMGSLIVNRVTETKPTAPTSQRHHHQRRKHLQQHQIMSMGNVSMGSLNVQMIFALMKVYFVTGFLIVKMMRIIVVNR